MKSNHKGSSRGAGSTRVKGQGKNSGQRLTAKDLRWTCAPIKPSLRSPRLTTLLGQARAVDALRRGLELYAPGFNIFVSGLLGSGRTRMVQTLLEELQPACRLGPDKALVHNFAAPNRPKLLLLPRGRGPAFREDMFDLERAIRSSLQARLSSRQHRTSRKLLLKATEERHRRLLRALGREATRVGCALVEFEQGQEASAEILPVHDGETKKLEDFDKLRRTGKVSKSRYEHLLREREGLVERLEELSGRIRRMFRSTHQELREIDRKAASKVLNGLFTEFSERWPQPEIAASLFEIRSMIEQNLDQWVGDGEREDSEAQPGNLRWRAHHHLRVHIVKTSADSVCPVVVETNPTYVNLFGSIEPARDGGMEAVERVHPGSILLADGGYLIMRARDLLNEPGVWPQLERTLRANKVEVREFDPSAGTTAGNLQPEAIPIDMKVILIGEPGVYESLVRDNPEFLQVFKVHAEFDSTVPNNAANRRRYADFLEYLSKSEGLRGFTPEAAAVLAEFGARRAGRRDRLSTCFGDLADIAREADFLSRCTGQGQIASEFILQALCDRENRQGLTREILERDLVNGNLLLQTSGEAVGQINGLTVLDAGMSSFGYPVRITAATGPASDGKSDFIDIEREADLSGPLHDKGVLILQGFLLEHLGRERALGIHVTLCFEQLYTEVDGDSASCAELLALLSSLAGVPISQGYGVTGSLNQKGEVQAVGGLNQKIEGFFRACKARRLTGQQGIIMPRANVVDLMLAPEVLAAVAAGRFHIHAVDHALEALQIATGQDAQMVMDKVRATLASFAQARDPS